MRLVDKIERGREALAAQTLTGDFVAEQMEQIFQHLLSHYRGGELTYEKAMGLIGELNALVVFLENLERAERQGIQALEQEVPTNG